MLLGAEASSRNAVQRCEWTAPSMQSKQAASPDPCMQGWACAQSSVWLSPAASPRSPAAHQPAARAAAQGSTQTPGRQWGSRHVSRVAGAASLTSYKRAAVCRVFQAKLVVITKA
jgi:hypothetical protein